MKIQAAIFDMDGTLIDSLPFWGVLWKEISRHYFDGKPFCPDKDVDIAIRTLPMREAMELIHQRHGVAESGAAPTEFTESLIADFYQTGAKPKKGVEEYLRFLKEKGAKLCVASASSSYFIDFALKAQGLRDYFSHIYSCKDVGKGKEHPDVYLAALEGMGVGTQGTWIFEDSLVALKTAKAMGIATVGVYDAFNYGNEEAQRISDHYIRENESFAKLISLWEDYHA